MARNRYQPKDLTPIFEGLEKADDRAIIAISGSMVEHALETAISCRLREPSTKEERDVFFHDGGIIRTFSEKIWIAFFLKIIGPSTRRDIDLIRLIRNQAAHDMNPLSFSGTPQIKSRCLLLTLARKAYGEAITNDPKSCFLLSARYYAVNLLMRSGDQSARIPSSFVGRASQLDE
jgi:hypothetical protein